MKPFVVPRWQLTSCCGHGWGHRPRAAHGTPRPRGGDLFRTLTTGVAALSAMAALAKDAEPKQRHYPPPPPAESPIDGMIDFHVHTAPDVFSRALTDEDTIAVAKDRGMAAIVLKNHVTHTADRAWLARRRVPGVNVFGGIVLNGAVGGINPEAVRWMWRMQGGHGRVVWFPTFDADNHVRRTGDAPEGIKVVGANGTVLPAVREVLKVCAEQKLVVHTGHASGAEALAIIEAARDVGCDRIAVTHCEFDLVGMSVEQMRKAASMGAKLEIAALGLLYSPAAALPFLRNSRNIPIKETAEHIRAVGAEHFILSTDLGQQGNPAPPDGYALLVGSLLGEGFTKAQVAIMGRENPGRLLMG